MGLSRKFPYRRRCLFEKKTIMPMPLDPKVMTSDLPTFIIKWLFRGAFTDFFPTPATMYVIIAQVYNFDFICYSC